MASPLLNVLIASRNCRAPDCATPRSMKRCTFFGSALSAAWARAIGPVSTCDRYSTPAGDRYCTDWPNAGAAQAATREHTVTTLRVLNIPTLLPTVRVRRDRMAARLCWFTMYRPVVLLLR